MPPPASPAYGHAYPPPPGDPAGEGPGSDAPGRRRRRFSLSDPLSIVLVAVIVTALLGAGLIGAELYARHRADAIVAAVVQCKVQDEATASFGATPVLWQYATEHYRSIHVETAGNRIGRATGMKLDLHLDDVRLVPTATSRGTVGAIDASISWTATGITETVRGSVPLFGSLVNAITTDGAAGTLTIEGVAGNIVTRPQVADNGVTLQVESVTGLGFALPREALQPFIDVFTSALTQAYPLGITAQNVEVTDDGIVSRFASRDAELPAQGDDPCFANV